MEFGTSLGLSTMDLAATVRDNGGGRVIGSELEPSRLLRARANLAEVGLDDLVEIREGDARETLCDPGGTVDLLLLDGWKDLDLPLLTMLKPALRSGSVVLADNIFTFKTALRTFVEHLQRPGSGFVSQTLRMADGFELAVRL